MVEGARHNPYVHPVVVVPILADTYMIRIWHTKCMRSNAREKEGRDGSWYIYH